MSDKGVQTIERALDIIELLATRNEGMGVTEIGVGLGLHKSTVHRLLNALSERGYIEKEPKYGKYKLGLKFVEVSSLFLGNLQLKTEAMPYLRNLAQISGNPVHLAILSGKDAVYIEKVEAVNSIRMYSQIGRRIPVYCSAIGKALLSGLADLELDKLMEGMEFKKFTPFTIDCKEKLKKEVEDVRRTGWAIDDREHEEDIRCIAAPVFDYTGKVIAAVSASGHEKVIREDRVEEISAYVVETAGNISRRMGYLP